MSRIPLSTSLVTAAAVVAAALGPQPAAAGPIFLRGEIVDGQFVAPEKAEDAGDAEKEGEAGKSGDLQYTIRYATISASREKTGYRFESEEIFDGPEKAEAVVAIVPLPQGTPLDEIALSAGRTSKVRKPVEGLLRLEGKAAETFVENLVKATGDVGFAAFIGRPLLVVPEFELGRRVNAHLASAAPDHHGTDRVEQLVLPVPQTKWAAGPLERLSITTDVTSADEPLRAIFSPTHQSEIERTSLTDAVVRVRQSDVHSENDYRLLWVEDEGDLGLRVLPFRLEGEDDGYFLLVGNPTGRADGSDVLEKDVTFVLDTSGSMRGEKIEQCRAAIEYCLGELGEGDRFNVVTFGSEVDSFRPQLVENTAENVESAREFVEDIVARGRTNIGGALEAALAGDITEGRPRITIFLTDGTPTAGELVPDKILEAAAAANVSKSAVYVLGVGHDVNVHLLDRLAESTEGAAEFVEPNEEIDVTVAGLYDRLAHPVLTDVAVDFGELDTHSMFPRKLPSLYRNSQVMLFGRYREGGDAKVTVSGTLAGVEREFTTTFSAPREADDAGHEYVPPLWASRKIGYLLQEMRLHGEDAELLEEVVRLSKKYGIVTEYTQFVATRAGAVRNGGVMLAGRAYGANLEALDGFRNEAQFERGRFGGFAQNGAFGGGIAGPAPAADLFIAGKLDEKAAVREVTKQIAMARQQETGRWAFNQAVNDKDLQSRVVTTGVANSYVDRRGQKVEFDQFVKHVGGRCFYLENGQWCEAEEAGERKERVVELYSDDYFTLLKQNEDFRKAQKLGWAISINVGDERVVVEKDGKRSDLPEPPQPRRQQRVEPNEGAALPRGLDRNQLPPNVQIERALQGDQLQEAPNVGRPLRQLPIQDLKNVKGENR